MLITGGTGSLGTALAEQLLRQPIAAIRIFSRDEYKQEDVRRVLEHIDSGRLRLLVGDVREVVRLQQAFRGVDVVVHAAALKRADTLEYNAAEAVRTNVGGSENVVNACVGEGISYAVLISSDKAVRPSNIYGATKMIAEQLFLRPYSGVAGPTFSVCRFGNFLGSRGSVLPMWARERKDRGMVSLTDARMTRYVITLREAASFVLHVVEHEKGGLHIPPMRVVRMADLAAVAAGDARVIEVGPRVGEKLHEELGDGRDSSQGPFMTQDEIRAMLADLTPAV
ncbi:MAG: polysaccharide biosynthesis protein [Betaproteobacteria bacterium]|nr:polysaccharide biosynthesis protein [Betaproteobacteria bacterium]